MSAPKSAAPRFYFDADLLGLAKLLAQPRADFTYPGDPGARVRKRNRPPCIITTPATLDTIWIPVVAARGWVIEPLLDKPGPFIYVATRTGGLRAVDLSP